MREIFDRLNKDNLLYNILGSISIYAYGNDYGKAYECPLCDDKSMNVIMVRHVYPKLKG